MSEWHDLIPVAELEPGDVTQVSFNKLVLAVYDRQNEFYVTAAYCTHARAPLCDGYLDGYIIECPLHQGCFDIRNGQAIEAPATRALKTFPARRYHDMIQIQWPSGE